MSTQILTETSRMSTRRLVIAAAAVSSCVSAPSDRDWTRGATYPLELTADVRAARLHISAEMKYNVLDFSAPIFDRNGFICYVRAEGSLTKPVMGTLVAIAVSADGEELGRTREKVVVDDEGHPMRFRFDPPLALERVARYVIDLEPY